MHILMYHEITAKDPSDVHAICVQHFIEQMGWLRQAGYRVISLAEWVKASQSRKAMSSSEADATTVAITFDDGYQDNYTLALPVLLEYNFPATIFLASGLIEATSRWRSGALANSLMLTWAQVLEMSSLGIEFGSHTATHADLTRLNQETIDEELRASRRQIEQQLGRPVELFAYPYSRSTTGIKQQVRTAGYQAACTYRPFYVGRAGRDPFELQRIGILATDTLPDFKAKLQGSLQRQMQFRRSQIHQLLRGGGQ
jgi:peptidoglycan/xylan/chitin deacetylase (PgdA/CDA1 family)